MSTAQQAHDLLNGLGCYSAGADIMAAKAVFLVIRVNGLVPQAANILKQEMLAKGGEVAVPSGALRMEAGRVDCIVMGTLAQYTRLVDILKQQPFELADLAKRLQLFTGLAAARPARSWFGTDADAAIGGLVDCDLQPSGVHDHTANAVAHAWTFLWSRVPTFPWYRTWPNDLSALLRAPSQRGSRTVTPSRWRLQCPSLLNKAPGCPATMDQSWLCVPTKGQQISLRNSCRLVLALKGCS